MIDHRTDEDRYPNLSDHGRAMLRFLNEHPSAPHYTRQSGHRLTPERLAQVRAYDAEVRAAPPAWSGSAGQASGQPRRHDAGSGETSAGVRDASRDLQRGRAARPGGGAGGGETPGSIPPWLADFVAMCYREVPFYRAYGAPPRSFSDIPTFDRADLSREPWNFVPDTLSLEGLMIHSTTGTTGHPLTIISHPVAGASYLPLLWVALDAYGITLTAGRGRVAYLLVGWQRKSFTYASVVPEMADAGTAKLNLHPVDWRDPDDRAKFLDACDPEFYTGDPLAFAELARLPLRTRPKALISTAMMLLPGLRRMLEERFGCPVIDLYSMNEAGPIAFEQAGRYNLLQPRLFVEILDANGASCPPLYDLPPAGSAAGDDLTPFAGGLTSPARGWASQGGLTPPGTRGEVVLTGGLNPFLPLLRYRTNDHASLSFQGSRPALVGLEGRPTVVYRTTAGESINNLDVTAVLKPFALPQFTLHQSADGALSLRVRAAAAAPDPASLRAALLGLFGADQRLAIEVTDTFTAGPSDKVIQYTSDINTGHL